MIGFMKRVRNWIAGGHRSAEIDRLDPSELTRIAGDAGVSVGDLRDLARRNPDAAGLLPQRVQAIGLDVETIARKEPAALRDMQRLCAQCRQHERCQRDLALEPNSAVWESYCPNALTLRALQ